MSKSCFKWGLPVFALVLFLSCKTTGPIPPEPIHDVLPDSLLSPSDTVTCASPVQVSASFCNPGDFTEMFKVKVRIDSSGFQVFVDSINTLNIVASTCTTVVFSNNWQVPSADSTLYTITLVSLLTGDNNLFNDTLINTAYSLCNIVFVDVNDNFFDPESLTINVGTTVRWTWVGIEPHTVTNGVGYSDSTLGQIFDSGTHLNGFVFDFKFDSLGSFPYFCFEHGPVTMPGFVKAE